MKNNKILIISGIVLAVILIVISSMIGTDSNNTKTDKVTEDGQTIVTNAQKESEAVKDDEKKDFTQIDVDKYLEYYAGEENKIVLIARPTCHYCQIAEPILQNISFKYDIEINYLNTDEFSDDDQTKFVNSDETFKDVFGTPFLLVVSNNKIVSSVSGLTDEAHYLSFFKSNGFINE
jgi:thiol-disulfide isomerase/thioredoxin